MHFSKTYAQLLLSLPPELRENAIQYRQLKKLINQVVRELSSLGLSPAVLQELLEYSKNESDELTKKKGKKRSEDGEEFDEDPSASTSAQRHHLPHLVYEVTKDSGRIEPHLRLWVDPPSHSSGSSPHTLDTQEDSLTPRTETDADDEEDQHGYNHGTRPQMSLLWALQRQPWLSANREGRDAVEVPTARISEVLEDDPDPASLDHDHPSFDHDRTPNEVVIPLAADMEFFQTLSTALEGLSAHMATVQSDFVDTLVTLSRTIAHSAHPASSSSNTFHPHSAVTSKPWSISISAKAKSDLYSWREIFQLYVEAEVFESIHELDRGERSVEESENRLKLFAERVTQRGLGDGRKLKLQSSRDALETFLELNVFILNIKKFQFANAEATRKILKKHTKRTSLPPYPLVPRTQSTSLPRVLVQAIGETLLPIIPHLDDYACLICTSIAFKPIRLSCGHLFCVRCLVKMQKRGSGDCPMCRAPCVLQADRSNVDWALLNFMQDWFPIESKEKLQQNEREAAREELEELGLNPDQTCRVM
ncbi:Transcriptional regulator of yeast-form-adherence 3 [Hypsizygus marmoreus]|uniref:Transcriptional regulator of yeast-form-adherence 3 n=1 Tax=Hypsizygus marmoreus TaxID=39966 RepID=A0A369K1R1_HYPMA|nr:Transcriptional regulator of yeast-form-adherence 3 [Hypsizygus marmoreus]